LLADGVETLYEQLLSEYPYLVNYKAVLKLEALNPLGPSTPRKATDLHGHDGRASKGAHAIILRPSAIDINRNATFTSSNASHRPAGESRGEAVALQLQT